MQPYFFPYIGYWQLINAVDTFVIFDDVNYIKKGYINKNSILISNEPKNIVLELLKVSQNKLINEIEVGNNTNKILKTIQRTYSKAPYYNDVYPILEKILMQKEKNLAKFIGNSIQIISFYLNINTHYIYSSSIEKNESLKSQEKIIDISNKMDAKIYINAIGGMKLYEKEKFTDNNIKLKFIKSGLSSYSQFENKFIPNLSIIDIMMFNDVNEIKKMLDNYELV